MAYTGVSPFPVPSVAGPPSSFPHHQFEATQPPTPSGLSVAAPHYQSHQYSAGPIRSQSSFHRTSHPAPYDIAQSPTRARFSQQDTNVYTAYTTVSPCYPPPSDQRQVQGARGDRRPSISRAPRRLRDENSFGESDLTAPTVNGPTNHVLVTAPLPPFHSEPEKNKKPPKIQFQKEGFPELGVTYDEVLLKAGKVPQLEGNDDLVLQSAIGNVANVLIHWPGYKIALKQIKPPRPASLSQMTRGELLVQVANRLRSWMMEVKRESKSTDPSFAIRSEEDLRGVFITSLVHLGGSNWQVHLWAVDRRKKRKEPESLLGPTTHQPSYTYQF